MLHPKMQMAAIVFLHSFLLLLTKVSDCILLRSLMAMILKLVYNHASSKSSKIWISMSLAYYRPVVLWIVPLKEVKTKEEEMKMKAETCSVKTNMLCLNLIQWHKSTKYRLENKSLPTKVQDDVCWQFFQHHWFC